MKIRVMHPKIGELSFRIQDGDRLLVGRDQDVDLEFNWDERISRKHAQITRKGERIFYQDLKSRNGSWYGNTQVVGEVHLDPGMSLLVGETIVVVPERTTLQQGDKQGDTQPGKIRPQTEPIITPPPTIIQPLCGPESTADLRSLDLPALGSETEAGARNRQHPRFVSTERVELKLENKEALKEAWTQDISKGGLFVETDSPPPFHASVAIVLDTPGGKLTLRGTVVHVVDGAMATQMSMPAGVGIQFVDLNSTTRKAIQSYIDGLAETLDSNESESAIAETSEESKQLVQEARVLLHESETEGLYAALDLDPKVAVRFISEKLRALSALFDRPDLQFSPPQEARILAAQRLIERIQKILTNSRRRMDYDFRNGHVRAAERIQEAKGGRGLSMEDLRDGWSRAQPDLIDRAALLTRKAFQARHNKDFALAVELGEDALECNPFFEELARDVAAWRELLARNQL